MVILSRRDFAKACLLAGALPISTLWAEDAEDQGSAEARFKRWSQKQNERFAEFNAFYQQAFDDYKAGIAVNWGANPMLRNRTRWVAYGDATRQVVDFRQGFAEVTLMKQQSNQPTAALMHQAKRILQQMFELSTQKALAEDKLEQVVSKRLNKGDMAVIHAEHSKESKRPVFAAVAPKRAVIAQAQATKIQLPNGQEAITIRVPINNDVTSKRAEFLATIKGYAEKYRLSVPLVSAVIEAESSFNPLATSGTPAYGLMQVVPTSAGIDVAQYLYQKKHLFSPQWLYDAENNILAGSTYLHLLHARYLKKINHPAKKRHCAIASYNTGAGNMAKAFGQNGLSSAIAKINRMTPEQVYQQLIQKLPYQETQVYLERVTRYIQGWLKQ